MDASNHVVGCQCWRCVPPMTGPTVYLPVPDVRAARRDRFAAAALTAVIDNALDPNDTMTIEASAALAVQYADALFAALDKEAQ